MGWFLKSKYSKPLYPEDPYSTRGYLGDWKSCPKDSTVLKRIKSHMKWGEDYFKPFLNATSFTLVCVDYKTPPHGQYDVAVYKKVEGKWEKIDGEEKEAIKISESK